jgi:hypothetical protein
VPSKTVPFPLTAEPSIKNSPEDRTSPIEGELAENSETEANRGIKYFNI